MSVFENVIEQEFPGAIATEQFVRRTTELLEPHGFDADNTIACVGACRDELTRPLIDRVFDAWGEAFNFSSLAGLLTLGRTGFAAARSHAPHYGGRERFAFVMMPHIGIDEGGTLGRLRRRGQDDHTPTCGALTLAAEQLRAGQGPAGLDPDDIEQSLLVLRLGLHLEDTGQRLAGLNMAGLTRAMRGAIAADLDQLIAGVDMTDVDYAVFTGVQIHALDGERVWPSDSYAVVGGDRVELSWDRVF